jgi:tyrosine-protein kinase Fes/Fps
LQLVYFDEKAIEFGKFSPSSDVYSFGVLLWELFNQARVPFAGVHNDQIADKLKTGKKLFEFCLCNAGFRLPKPDLCPDEVYKLMQDCWSYTSGQRPSFKELYTELHKLWLEEKQRANINLPVLHLEHQEQDVSVIYNVE